MKPGKTPKGHISAAEARPRAARQVISNIFKDVLVCDGAAAKWNIDGVRRKDVWLLYRKQPRPDDWIPAQDLMVVCQRTGRVLHDRLAFPDANLRPAPSGKSTRLPPTSKRWLDSRWWE